MVVYPPAKINLGLLVTEKREDGYHNLDTVFFPLPLTDILEVNLADISDFTITGLPVPGNPTGNLCLRAVELIRERVSVPKLDIHLHKQIPAGGGLGGGSSNGAYTLLAVDKLCSLGLDSEVLTEIALSLGSDCPFFLQDKPASGTGRGEILKPVSIDLAGYFIALVLPGIHISTAKAFSMIYPQKGRKSPSDIIAQYPVEEWKNELINDFEESISSQYPLIKEIKEYLYRSGALYAAMTGTGSTVFGIFKNNPGKLTSPGSSESHILKL